MNEIEVYITLFTSSFISSTILPGHSEITLTAFIFLNKFSIINLILIASLGNILGSIANWYLGKKISTYKDKKWFLSFNDGKMRSYNSIILTCPFPQLKKLSKKFIKNPFIKKTLKMDANITVMIAIKKRKKSTSIFLFNNKI